jgi:hypothetical protein
VTVDDDREATRPGPGSFPGPALPGTAPLDRDEFAAAGRDPPAGWERFWSGDWVVWLPDEVPIPFQGWRIRVSAWLDDAEPVVDSVADYCLRRLLPFKFVHGLEALLRRNAAWADGSATLATIYPADDEGLEHVLGELGGLLGDRDGPWIPGSLRWGAGPLHISYGGLHETGAGRTARRPGPPAAPSCVDAAGRLVPRRADAGFRLPECVTPPPFLRPHLGGPRAPAAVDLPYDIEIGLQFSNGTGLYQARDRVTGGAVVLKEARADGADALQRLRHEHEVLTRLDGLGVAPAPLGWFRVGDQQFLAEESVDGRSLEEVFSERYPLAMPEPDAATLARYTAWVLDVQEQVEAAVARAHGRGVVLGDLDPGAIMLRPDGRPVFVGVETASCADPAADPDGVAADRRALAALRLFWFLPLTDLIPLTATKAAQLASDIAQAFPVPGLFLREAVAAIAGGVPPAGYRASASEPRSALVTSGPGGAEGSGRRSDSTLEAPSGLTETP